MSYGLVLLKAQFGNPFLEILIFLLRFIIFSCRQNPALKSPKPALKQAKPALKWAKPALNCPNRHFKIEIKMIKTGT